MVPLDFPNDGLPAPHPEFGLAALRSIRLPDNWQNPGTADYLAHSVRRKPGDLRAHARRIALHQALGQADQLAAAVVDLFIALSDKGGTLKQQMLKRHSDVLRLAGCFDALSAALAGRLSPHLTEIALPASVLARPATGSFNFVRPTEVATEPAADAAAGAAGEEADLDRLLIEELRRQGLVDENDELEADNPPAEPTLRQQLIAEFRRQGLMDLADELESER